MAGEVRLSALVAAMATSAVSAARIARVGQLRTMAEQKPDRAFGSRMYKDFATVADVLMQTAIIRQLSDTLPSIRDNIRGEETGEFAGVELESLSERELSGSLQAMGLHSDTAADVAKLVHGDRQDVESSASQAVLDALRSIQATVPADDVGVWIDPLDSTSSFMGGVEGTPDPKTGMFTSSCLPVAVVLVGAFRISTGEPLASAACQPFSATHADIRCVWGVFDATSNVAESGQLFLRQDGHVELAETFSPWRGPSHEPAEIHVVASKRDPLSKCAGSNNVVIRNAPGAGYKLLCVAEGLVDACLGSLPAMYPWDTCGVHALVKARGGELLYGNTLGPIRYSLSDNSAHQGIVAIGDKGQIGAIKTVYQACCERLRHQDQ